MRPAEHAPCRAEPASPFPEPRIAVKPPQRVSPGRDFSGPEPSLRSLHYSLALLLKRQEQDVKAAATPLSLTKEPSSRAASPGFEEL